MKKYGLIGYPLSHSFSKSYFTKKFKDENLHDYQYTNYPIENIDKIENLILENEELIGLNVTIPYKEQVLKYLHEIDDLAKRAGAVNTLKIRRNGKKIHLKGYNTDIYGFRESIVPYLNRIHDSALILGTGGASKSIAFVLEQLGIPYKFVSRKPVKENTIAYHDLNAQLIDKHKIIINTTPLGTYPNIETFPDIPYDAIGTHHLLYDLVYNPEITKFLEKGNKNGAQTINGLKMLHLQAEKSWEIWNS